MLSQGDVPLDAGPLTGEGVKQSAPKGIDFPTARDLKEKQSTPKGADSPNIQGWKNKLFSAKNVGTKLGKNTPVSDSPVGSPEEEQQPPSP